VADIVRDEPYFAGYDLFNEPHPVPLPPYLFSRRLLFPLYGSLIEQIAHTDASHLFLVEGTLYAGFPTPVERLQAPNVLYSKHLYVGSLVDLPWDSGPIGQVMRGQIDQSLEEAQTVGAPLFIGELGIDARSAGAAAWTSAAVTELAQTDTGWTWWQWSASDGWGVRSRSGALDMTVLRRLATPYVRSHPPALMWAWTGRSLMLQARTAGDAELEWPTFIGAPQVSGACSLSGSVPELTVRVVGRCLLSPSSR
jgi:hypothetical protein